MAQYRAKRYSEFSGKSLPTVDENCKAMETFYRSTEDFINTSEIISPWR